MPEAPLVVRGGLSVSPREVERVMLGCPAVDLFRPRAATEDLRVPPRPRRRSWAPDDLA